MVARPVRRALGRVTGCRRLRRRSRSRDPTSCCGRPETSRSAATSTTSTPMSERMLPWLRERPVTLIRAPDGVGGKRYFQKAVSSYAPEWIRTVRIPAPSAGRDVDFVVCDDRATLLWLGNQATLEFHPAPVRADQTRPARSARRGHRPAGGVVRGSRRGRLAGARRARRRWAWRPVSRRPVGKGCTSSRRSNAATTRTSSAGRPRDSPSIVAARRPDLVTDEFRKAKRQGRVMLDPSRNGTGATIVAPYSPRAREEATVSFPVMPDELASVSPGDFTIATVPALLDRPGPSVGPRWPTSGTGSRRRSSATEPTTYPGALQHDHRDRAMALRLLLVLAELRVRGHLPRVELVALGPFAQDRRLHGDRLGADLDGRVRGSLRGCGASAGGPCVRPSRRRRSSDRRRPGTSSGSRAPHRCAVRSNGATGAEPPRTSRRPVLRSPGTPR